jgi:UDP-N-acetylglucosamine diphosphorylase/glucosamine-1-phosphate N-acetyltransferase
MKALHLDEQEVRANFFPFTLTRPVVDIRCGILTIREKWKLYLGNRLEPSTGSIDANYEGNVFSANILPSASFAQSVGSSSSLNWEQVRILQYPWHIFTWNDWAIREDFALLTAGRKTSPLPNWVTAEAPENIFVEEGAAIKPCFINASTGPVYIGKRSLIMEGAMIRGPFALCEGSVVKMGSKIYGATTVGPYSTVGGEIVNSVIFGYSNKAHDGYLGHSVIGEWCNLGAGTSNSNIKNNASEVKVWVQSQKDYLSAGVKCGMFMGDYSRSAINTSFNTGTVIGVCANIFGQGLTPKLINSFTWGSQQLSRYEFGKALSDISNWMKLKNRELTDEQATALQHIFNESN